MLNVEATPRGTDIFSLGRNRLAWLQERQQVLAGNIANADTPDYAPRDVSPFQAALGQFDVSLARTDEQHMNLGEDGSDIEVRPEAERSLDGNRVSLDHEMEQVATVNDQQHLVVNLYGKYMNMFQTALGR
ncbi:flagellar basal body rod protein FlgB [Kozakia baliensis]|uniref:Flagellar basal body rod protein FlgB n=1 Tax=Kozakia baliensis TaxID=153496 RepID=A0A1D8UQG4_9PROT|nr:flagellar basal body rod protein FlgB [Kozakia baliensis]AOX15878.1 flagellar biosynthesis protein FlgB [Kozakia baliensis]GBR27696.1 flagellar basal-body rod protein FlgB [Kozakia baliensis NRIC 0488]GEL64243.1 flagellar basal body rod protein FlgB [Kozakia baliensis]